MVSFDVGGDGGLVFEAVIAVSRDFAAHIGASDCVRLPQLSAGDVTSVREQLGVDLALTDIAEVLARGYGQQFDLSLETLAPASEEFRRESVGLAHDMFDNRRWTEMRLLSADFDHHATTDVMLGIFEAHVALAADGRLDHVLLSGDIIANSVAIETLEGKLRGCRADASSIDAVVAETLGARENFILGISDTGTVTSTIMQALA